MTKILLIDDDDSSSDMLKRRLESRRYQVIVAIDGVQGVALAKSESPDLILMDFSLPRLDGWSATQQIRAASETATVPIIGLTAHAFDGDRQKAFDAGCNDYDTKPVDFPRLLKKIETQIRKRTT